MNKPVFDTLDCSRLGSEFYITRVTLEQLNEVFALYQTNPLYFQHCPPKPSRESVKDDLTNYPTSSSPDKKYYLGCWKKNELVAVIDVVLDYPTDKIAWIGLFMVHGQHQQKEFGSKLFHLLEDFLAKAHYPELQLAYVKTYPEAAHFWTKIGFQPTGNEIQQGPLCLVMARKRI
ncbi:GNAT family N-acetyltransferase [Streptococcus respiraculi]|uniref:GNAT family N-acetyltransferase n=1 Tax=Streptococcus respiraculi TaxID=2021971 RepID=UPI0013C40E36|nr:GNAT family N-acetyltransferase [Streptococcus respiraculi]